MSVDTPASPDLPRLDVARLRHPDERRVYAMTLAINVVLLALAVWLIFFGGAWVARRPWVEKGVGQVRALATAVLLGPAVLVLLRGTRRAFWVGRSVRVSSSQLPAVHAALVRFCAALGVSPIPELHVTAGDIDGRSARAFTTWREGAFIVMNSKHIDLFREEQQVVWRFNLAREVGRLHAGHTRPFDELFLAYILNMPVLRTPLMRLRTFTQDRYAAALVPDGIAALLYDGVGRRLVETLDVAAYVAEACAYGGKQSRLAQYKEPRPPVALRVAHLVKEGFFAPDGGPPERLRPAPEVEPRDAAAALGDASTRGASDPRVAAAGRSP